LPGHAIKLDKLIETISKHSYVDNNDELMSENFSNYENKSENGSNSNIADNSRE
jgi:hypothetical protein